MKNKFLKSELEIINDLKIMFEPRHGSVGIGDDAAVLPQHQLVSTDAIVEGVHFLRDYATWDDVAYKLFASNASDIAAMGGFVQSYVLTLSLPEYWTNDNLRDFFLGVRSFLQIFPADLVGGDLVRSKEFFASITVLGKNNNRPWLRSTAKEGDFVYCTGTIGDSRLYLNRLLKTTPLPLKNIEYFKQRHYRPTPRLAWAQALRSYRVSAAMDISDGLVEDLNKIAQASQLSFCIDGNIVPISEDYIGHANIQEHRLYYLREALLGGEDYELLFTSPDILDEEKLRENGLIVKRIGRMISKNDPSFVMLDEKRYSPTEFRGFIH